MNALASLVPNLQAWTLQLFWIALGAALITQGVRSRFWQAGTPSWRQSGFLPLLLAALPALALAALLQAGGYFQGMAILAAGLLFSWLLSTAITQDATLRGLLLLAAGSLLYMLWPGAETLLAFLAGLLLFNLIRPTADHPPGDLLPAAAILTALAWQHANNAQATHVHLVLIASAAVLLTQALSAWLPGTGKDEAKAIGLRALAIGIPLALLAYIGINNALHAPSFVPHASALLLGVFASAVFQLLERRLDTEPDQATALRFSALALTGILVLLASRLFGLTGLALAGLGLLAYTPARHRLFWQSALLFIAARLALQIFVTTHNSNITGVNLMHPYIFASLFAGLALVYFAKPIGQWLSPRWNAVFWLILPLGAGYFLHAEAASGLLAALLVGGCIVSFLDVAASPNANQTHPLMLSLRSTSLAFLGGALLTLGEDATRPQRLAVLGVLLIAVLAVGLIQQRLPQKPSQA